MPGLHWIFPLANAGPGRLAPSGQWQMSAASANATGTFSPRSLAAVLERDSDAVSQSRAELEDRQRRAVAAEALELAGRIHSELRVWGGSPASSASPR
jgi:hypothetical protein